MKLLFPPLSWQGQCRLAITSQPFVKSNRTQSSEPEAHLGNLPSFLLQIQDCIANESFEVLVFIEDIPR
jgi:hypothetical protein